MDNTMTTDKQKAIQLADKYEHVGFVSDHRYAQNEWCTAAALELRSQHARIAELEAQPVSKADELRAAALADDFTTRGLLAELKCWHRLTKPESDELVAFFSRCGAPHAPALPPRVPLTESQLLHVVDMLEAQYRGTPMNFGELILATIRCAETVHGIRDASEATP